MTKLHLTSRALDDLQDIYEYSVEEWGEPTAVKYIQAFEDSFSLLQDNKNLLRVNKKISSRFRVYNVRMHYLICDVVGNNIFILTIKHVSMNLLECLQELEPHLEDEAKTLYKKLRN